MKLHWQISAGEFFELLRPAALVVAALLSIWVLASARRRRFHIATVVAWAIGTFFFPFIVLPIYLIVRSHTRHLNSVAAALPLKLRFTLPTAYGLVLLVLLGLYFYRDYHTVEAHLARAAQAKVLHNRPQAIREYRAALASEDDPHTHKLLGIELADAREWTQAAREFRAAEQGGEPDLLLPFRMAQALEFIGQRDAAVREYKKFLASDSCNQMPPHDWCATAQQQVDEMLRSSAPSEQRN